MLAYEQEEVDGDDDDGEGNEEEEEEEAAAAPSPLALPPPPPSASAEEEEEGEEEEGQEGQGLSTLRALFPSLPRPFLQATLEEFGGDADAAAYDLLGTYYGRCWNLGVFSPLF